MTVNAPTKDQLKQWDEEDPLNWTRAEFEIPDARKCGGKVDGETVYFCGNSLGLLNKRARQHMMEELDVWSTSAVTGHFKHPHGRPWKTLADPMLPVIAKLLGAKESECAHSSTLTTNMHTLLTTWYAPTPKRWKIVIERGAFPSDWYAAQSHPGLHRNVLSDEQIENAILAVEPREGEELLRTVDILKVIEDNKDEIALVWLPMVQYYTGQVLDIAPMVKKTHEAGALFGLDMAHGIGNIKMHLDDWGVDFAVWCTYKYLNSGPGGTGGFFIREGLSDNGRRLAGWWGVNPKTRFDMTEEFDPTPGAQGYMQSNTGVLGSIPLLATLELIDKVNFDNLRAKGDRLTGALDALLKQSKYYIPADKLPKEEDDTKIGFHIITPELPNRGSQLSLFIHPAKKGIMPRVFEKMVDRGLVGDERFPYVIRLAPMALYNTFQDVGRAAEIVEEALAEVEAEGLGK
ncbi:uncharacterized protein CcaverHIS019_0407830 [Cutaneotrichosporon cavernicola]|uniref:Kynureninase n=1 Tax=Cutaneotrichosporon cavernicola TaxID=279322 RepID=A0AA48L4V0_9TREE|nr:uncharacterized protein CcaverHIS019_0407830 [Cutaneotrichosporon cavernicola]BEI91963.1 hypothetical protein CcaverHIS019_0407830 [Cutaneotrichosporon cavernicola]BEI99734.1 hypothetical protein CcaverHIS631_0407770 [Cutaneotrichosporon cavernicola]BEJ07510.1 hypothetical protein CcaverHIS641_0407790 [Cutaneotrichosporon cavernicola]